jgi:predicted nucleotidyltransferase
VISVNPELLKLITERIVRGFAPERVILFGSHARGDAGPHSDVDLLVVYGKFLMRAARRSPSGRVLVDLPLSKDIVVTKPEELPAGDISWARCGDLRYGKGRYFMNEADIGSKRDVGCATPMKTCARLKLR